MKQLPDQTPPPDLLEQAHLALLRGHTGQARSFLDRLVVVEPDNEAAQDLRATVIAQQAALVETERLQAGGTQAVGYPGAAPPWPGGLVRSGSLWTRALPLSASALLNSRTARTWPWPLRLAIRLAPVLIFILFSVVRFWPQPHTRDAQAARALVEAAYRSAQRGATDDIQSPGRWEDIDHQYGRVLAWRIRGENRLPWRTDHWQLEADVTRQRAVTRERVEAIAGPSSIYGYYTSIVGVKVESARALP